MSQQDTRPKWLLRKQASISSRRLTRFGVPPDRLALAEWWTQIGEAAGDLKLDAGPFEDWQAWPHQPTVVDDGGELL